MKPENCVFILPFPISDFLWFPHPYLYIPPRAYSSSADEITTEHKITFIHEENIIIRGNEDPYSLAFDNLILNLYITIVMNHRWNKLRYPCKENDMQIYQRPQEIRSFFFDDLSPHWKTYKNILNKYNQSCLKRLKRNVPTEFDYTVDEYKRCSLM